MPSLPRGEIFNPDAVGIYHCWNRCVRRAYLCGWDPITCKDCSHRKKWLRDRLVCLAGAMGIDVLDYAILDNHVHVVLRNRPDIVATWSNEEVALRWRMVCPERKNSDGMPAEPTELELKALVLPEQVAELRTRLSDISWFMRLWTQGLARMANREDDERGRFFAERFGSEPIESVAQLLACSFYVNLNLVRAGMALTPESSEYTSAYDRLAARLRQQRIVLGDLPSKQDVPSPDAWLAPLYLDPQANAYEGVKSDRAANSLLTPGPKPHRASDKGFLPITDDVYLSLLDAVGRQLRSDKRGAIPEDLPHILDRLGIEYESFVGLLETYSPKTRRMHACESDRPVDGYNAYPTTHDDQMAAIHFRWPRTQSNRSKRQHRVSPAGNARSP